MQIIVYRRELNLYLPLGFDFFRDFEARHKTRPPLPCPEENINEA